MIPIFSHRPFHFLRLSASSVKDTLCGLFFKAISCLESNWSDYAAYYSRRNIQRKFSLALYGDHLIQPSLNRLYPGKRIEIPAPQISNKEYELNDIEILHPDITGFVSELALII